MPTIMVLPKKKSSFYVSNRQIIYLWLAKDKNDFYNIDFKIWLQPFFVTFLLSGWHKAITKYCKIGLASNYLIKCTQGFGKW